MPRFFKLALLGTSALLLTAGLALASPKADTNNDGTISQAEFMAEASDRFINTDLNADGALTKDEMKASHERRRTEHAEKRFEKSDANGDGVISKSEYDAKRAEHTEKREARRDLNNDGTVDVADKELHKAKRAKRKEKQAERKANRDVNRDNYRKRIKRDANGDGLITRAEYDTATEAMFIWLDANADGVLTKGEGKKRRRGKRGQHEHR